MVGYEGFQPLNIGLKDSSLIYQVFINQLRKVFVRSYCALQRQYTLGNKGSRVETAINRGRWRRVVILINNSQVFGG